MPPILIYCYSPNLWFQLEIGNWKYDMKWISWISKLKQSLKNKFHWTKGTIFLNGAWCQIWTRPENLGEWNFFGDIQKVCSFKIPEFWPPLPPCLSLLPVRFWAPTPSPSPKVRSFWLELTLSPSISIYLWNLEFKFKLIMSTSWTQRVFYEATVESL